MIILKSSSTFIVSNLDLKLSGNCPGDKVPTSENELLCTCRSDSIELLDDKCVMCSIGEEVPNEDQSACVGMLEGFAFENDLLVKGVQHDVKIENQ